MSPSASTSKRDPSYNCGCSSGSSDSFNFGGHRPEELYTTLFRHKNTEDFSATKNIAAFLTIAPDFIDCLQTRTCREERERAHHSLHDPQYARHPTHTVTPGSRRAARPRRPDSNQRETRSLGGLYPTTTAHKHRELMEHADTLTDLMN
jgi:hypothetical protein